MPKSSGKLVASHSPTPGVVKCRAQLSQPTGHGDVPHSENLPIGQALQPSDVPLSLA